MRNADNTPLLEFFQYNFHFLQTIPFPNKQATCREDNAELSALPATAFPYPRHNTTGQVQRTSLYTLSLGNIPWRDLGAKTKIFTCLCVDVYTHMRLSVVCMGIMLHVVTVKVGRQHWICMNMESQSWASMWVLGTQPASSRSALNCELPL